MAAESTAVVESSGHDRSIRSGGIKKRLILRWLESKEKFEDLRGKTVIACPDEVDFQKMYGNLGNKHNQDRIRELNPQPKDATRLIHCKLLLKNPKACNDVPLGDGKRGICRSNPYHPENVARREALKAEFEKEYPTIIPDAAAKRLEQIGQGYSSAIKMGLVSDLSQLTPLEFVLASNHYFSTENKRAEQLAQLQAKLIISELAALLNSGKKK